MTVKYKTVITKAGAIKLAAATLPNGKKVNLTAMAVGDGGGTLPVPDPNQTKLVKEVWRHALNKISQDKKNKITSWRSCLSRRRPAVSGCANSGSMMTPAR